MQKVSEQEVYSAIKAGFSDFRTLAKISLAKDWSGMTNKKRCEMARKLVYMGQVAKMPEAYFSREETEEEWLGRANNWAKEYNVQARYAFYIVQDPKGIVFNNLTGLLNSDLLSAFYNFCSDVQNWEYGRTRNDGIADFMYVQESNKIFKKVKDLKKKVELAKTNPLLRPLKSLCMEFQR